MKMYKQIMALMIFALLFGFGAFIEDASAASKSKKVTKGADDFTVETEMGIDGYASYDAPAQITVTVTSKDNFEGTVSVKPTGDEIWGTVVAYGKDVSLAKGEAKQVKLLVNGVGQSGGRYQLNITDKKGKVLYEETNRINVSMGDSYNIGVLSDDYSSLSYMKGEYSVKTIELTKDSFPENADVLEAFDLIMIDNYDTSQLSDKQYQSLKTYVNNGGQLFLGLGANYQNVLHAFTDDFVSGTVNGIKKLDITFTSKGNGNDEEKLVLNGTDTVDFTMKDAKALNGFTKENTVYHKNYGAGQVTVCGFSMSMEPLVSFERNATVARNLMALMDQNINIDDVVKDNSYIYDMAESITDTCDSSKRPNIMLYGILLAVYVFLVGPGIYLILKKMKKQPVIWLAIPCIAFVCTFLIFLTGKIYRIQKPFMSSLSMISMDENGVTEDTYANVTCPDPKRYTFDMSEQYHDFGLNPNGWQYNIFGDDENTQCGYTLKEGQEGYKVVVDNKKAFNKTDISAKRVLNADDIGRLELDFDCKTTGISGAVVNNTNYDLTGTVVYYAGSFYILGDIKRGDKKELKEEEARTGDPYSVFEYNYDFNGFTYLANRHSSKSDVERYRESIINTQIGYICNENMEYGNVTVWAKIGEYSPKMIANEDIKQQGIGVIYKSFRADYSDIAEGEVFNSLSEYLTDYDGDMDGINIWADTVAEYEINDLEDVDIYLQLLRNADGVKDSESADSATAESGVAISAMNPKTGDYEPIFTDSDTLSSEELSRYIRDDKLTLKYSTSSSNVVPNIIVRGK